MFRVLWDVSVIVCNSNTMINAFSYLLDLGYARTNRQCSDLPKPVSGPNKPGPLKSRVTGGGGVVGQEGSSPPSSYSGGSEA